jgi:hypothetical protein
VVGLKKPIGKFQEGKKIAERKKIDVSQNGSDII